jgi:hypothetical protein
MQQQDFGPKEVVACGALLRRRRRGGRPAARPRPFAVCLSRDMMTVYRHTASDEGWAADYCSNASPLTPPLPPHGLR